MKPESLDQQVLCKKCTKGQGSGQSGLSILARMIAEAYIEELDQKRFATNGCKAAVYLKKSR